MFRDNVPTITLGQWELEAEYFEDEFLSGIVPVLFADVPEVAVAAALADKPSLKKDLERLNRVFFIPESVGLGVAGQIVRKPRLGDAEYAFKTRNLDRLFEVPDLLPRRSASFSQQPGNTLNMITILKLHIYTLRPFSIIFK